MNRRDIGAPSPWADVIGECYTAASLARVLEWTDAEVAAATTSGRLLALRTTDGLVIYPRFQLQEGHVVDGLEEVLALLRTGTESVWTWAQWLATPTRRSDGQEGPSHIEELASGNLDEVLLAALHDAAAWRT